MLITKLVPIDFHIVFFHTMEVNGPCLVTNILQNILLFIQQMKNNLRVSKWLQN